MNTTINEILEKYKDINFIHCKDRDTFIELINSFANKNLDEEQLKNLVQLVENSFVKYGSFDNDILYNPLEFIESIVHNNLLGKKIDDEECELIISRFTEFESYLSWKIDEKKFLEDKYNIKINLVTDNVMAISAWIYWQWLVGDLIKANAISKLKKLLGFYPINYIENIKLENIVIVNFFYKEDQYWAKMRLWWFETNADNNLYLSYSNLAESFDHELYHQAMQYHNDFSIWQALRLGQDTFYLYEDLDKRVNGFARNYGKENIGEDQATMAEELIINYYDLIERVKTDTMLAKKLELVKKAFYELSDWIMDEEFWKREYE